MNKFYIYLVYFNSKCINVDLESKFLIYIKTLSNSHVNDGKRFNKFFKL